MDFADEQWTQKGATLSDKHACEEFGLQQEEIVAAIRAGKLQYRIHSMYGNPWFRLLRREVEAFATEVRGKGFERNLKVKREFAEIERELERLRRRIKELEKRKAELAG